MRTSADPFDLAGRQALVTGATRGIGLAIAQALGRRGAEVWITGRKPETVETAARSISTPAGSAKGVVCHQGEQSAIGKLFDQIDAGGSAADVVVINAATNPVMGPLLETEPAAWEKILAVNLTGSFLTAQHAARRMLPRKSGSIIFMASIAGLDPIPGIGAYSVSKAGLLGLVKALAKELGPAGIRVNAIAPGLVETRFAEALFRDQRIYQRVVSQIPLGRHGQPEDIVGAALFLASDASAYVTGQVLVVDGGSRV